MLWLKLIHNPLKIKEYRQREYAGRGVICLWQEGFLSHQLSIVVYSFMVTLRFSAQKGVAGEVVLFFGKKEDSYLINYFAVPLFPVFLRIKGKVYIAESIPGMQSLLFRCAKGMKSPLFMVDARWKLWLFYPEKRIIRQPDPARRYSQRELLVFCGIPPAEAEKIKPGKYPENLIYAFLLDYLRK